MLSKARNKQCIIKTPIKMNKNLIKEVHYSHKMRFLMVTFLDGSKFGEKGETAVKTFNQLNDNKVPYVDMDKL